MNLLLTEHQPNVGGMSSIGMTERGYLLWQDHSRRVLLDGCAGFGFATPHSHSIIFCACKPAQTLAFGSLILPSTVIFTVI
jgi:hypothetical protein